MQENKLPLPQELEDQESGSFAFDDIKDRRRQVFHLKSRGYTHQEIADMFGLHRDTIKKDVRLYKTQLKDAQTKLDRDDYVGQVRSDYEQMRDELWKDLQKATKPGERTRIIALIAKLRAEETKILHDCDLLEKAPQRIEHTHNVQGSITHLHIDLSETMLEAVETLIISQHMKLSPENLLMLRGREPEFIDVPAKGEPKPLPQEKARKKPLPEPKVVSENSTIEQIDHNNYFLEGD